MVDRTQLDAWTIAAGEGDRAALEPLFRALWPMSVAYASRMLGDVALAEDASQLALTRMFGHLDQFDHSRDALTWAFAHVTWECRTARKKQQRRGEVALVETEAVDGRALLEERDLICAALSALDELAPHDVDTIVASLTGERGDVPPATFRKRLERALARLRASWRTRHG